jgi:hypothetical protein
MQPPPTVAALVDDDAYTPSASEADRALMLEHLADGYDALVDRSGRGWASLGDGGWKRSMELRHDELAAA